jgi:hypothetical protein
MKDWLKNGYSDQIKVEKDRDSGALPSEVVIALLGVHLRNAMPLADRPSDMDIQLLKDLYGTHTAIIELPVITINVSSHRKHKFHHPWTTLPAPNQSISKEGDQSCE